MRRDLFFLMIDELLTTMLSSFSKNVVILSTVPVLFSCLTALITAVLQSATSIHEQMTVYLVRIVSFVVSIIFLWSWLTGEALTLFNEFLATLSVVGRT